MARKHSDKATRTARRLSWPVIVVGTVVIAGLLLMVFPRSTNGSNTGMSVGPKFEKHGEIRILHNDGSMAFAADVEIAETPEKREVGMMGRTTMDEHQGMYFVFEDERPLGFWMKNTILPLDIIFINAANKITTIHRNAVPYSEETYPSAGAAQYVLELNGGVAAKFGIVEGDVVQLTR